MFKKGLVSLCFVSTLLATPLFATHDCTVTDFRGGQRVLVNRSLNVKSLSDLSSVYNGHVVSWQDYIDASNGDQGAIARVERFWREAPWHDAKNKLNDYFIKIRNCIFEYEYNHELLQRNTDENGNVYITLSQGGNLTDCVKLTPTQFNLFNNPRWFERLQTLSETSDVNRVKAGYAVSDYLDTGALQGEMKNFAQCLWNKVVDWDESLMISVQPANFGGGEPQANSINSDYIKGIEFKNLTDFWGNKVDITLSETK